MCHSSLPHNFPSPVLHILSDLQQAAEENPPNQNEEVLAVKDADRHTQQDESEQDDPELQQALNEANESNSSKELRMPSSESANEGEDDEQPPDSPESPVFGKFYFVS